MTIETTFSQAREQSKTLMDRAVDDREVVLVCRRSGPLGGGVAMIAADELQSLMETAHLLRSPKNLLPAMRQPRNTGLIAVQFSAHPNFNFQSALPDKKTAMSSFGIACSARYSSPKSMKISRQSRMPRINLGA